jgi:hypothetical protein
MAKLIGQLLFGLARDLAEDQAKSVAWQFVQKLGAWLDTNLGPRTRLIVGLLIGFAAAGFFPLIALLSK